MTPGDVADLLSALRMDAETLDIQTLLTASLQGGAPTSGHAGMLGDQADSLRVSVDVLAARVAHLDPSRQASHSDVPMPGAVGGSTMPGLLDANRQFLRRVEVLLERWPPEDVTTVSVLFAVETESARRVRFLVEATGDDPEVSSGHAPLPRPQ